MAGLPVEDVAFLYDNVRDLYLALPAPSDEALQAVLDRESDPQARQVRPSDFVDLSFLQQREQSGLLATLYR